MFLAIAYTFVILYFLVLGFLMVLGIHRYWLIYLFMSHRRKQRNHLPTPGDYPAVTVQLPVYNEQYVVERLIRAAASMDYPADKLSIQVLDDSTDETRALCRRVVDELASAGVDIELIHRDDRTGFKAGALENGLNRARGELVAVFDADFIPSKSFLKETVGFFADPIIGMVQVRWDFINEQYSLFTRLQAMLLDGHFVIEHAARNWSDRFFNFNGTAGIWRIAAIHDAGGWQHDTLTEDLDLSYRAQMKGWRFLYLLDVTCKSEIPVEMNGYKTQQFRWAKGSIETGKKILPRIFASRLPFKVKLESFFHMGSNLAYVLLLALSLLTLPTMVVRIHMGWRHIAWLDLIVFFCAFFPVTLFYIVAQKQAGKRWIRRMALIPILMSLGIGISASNARAVWEGLKGKKSPFIRTPKYKVERNDDRWWQKVYGQFDFKGVLVEIFMTFYTLQAVLFSLYFEVYLSVPFLLLFVFGFGYVSWLSIYHAYLRSQRAAEMKATA